VLGVRLDNKAKDLLGLHIVNLTKDFHPDCRLDKVTVHFIPVKKDKANYIPDLWVVKIIIKQGDVSKLYSVTKRTYESFMRLHG